MPPMGNHLSRSTVLATCTSHPRGRTYRAPGMVSRATLMQTETIAWRLVPNPNSAWVFGGQLELSSSMLANRCNHGSCALPLATMGVWSRCHDQWLVLSTALSHMLAPLVCCHLDAISSAPLPRFHLGTCNTGGNAQSTAIMNNTERLQESYNIIMMYNI
jgi:hypothetical protein